MNFFKSIKDRLVKKLNRANNTNNNNNNNNSNHTVASSVDDVFADFRLPAAKSNLSLLKTTKPKHKLSSIDFIQRIDAQHLMQEALGFTNVKELGKGAFGNVYSINCTPQLLTEQNNAPNASPAIDEDGNVQIACKIFYLGNDKDNVRYLWTSFLEELSALRAATSHERIVSFYGNFTLCCNNDATETDYTVELVQDTTGAERYGMDGTRTVLLAGICMEKLSMSLHAWINKYQLAYLTGDMIEQIFLQIGDALRYLHAQHIVHFDIKADNIALCADHGARQLGPLKLIDFGIAKSYPAEVYAKACNVAASQSLDDDQNITRGNDFQRGLPLRDSNPFLMEAYRFAMVLIRMAIRGEANKYGSWERTLLYYNSSTDFYCNEKHLALKRILLRCANPKSDQQVTIEWALKEYAHLLESIN